MSENNVKDEKEYQRNNVNNVKEKIFRYNICAYIYLRTRWCLVRFYQRFYLVRSSCWLRSTEYGYVTIHVYFSFIWKRLNIVTNQRILCEAQTMRNSSSFPLRSYVDESKALRKLYESFTKARFIGARASSS
jgi:hypothetical protein